jgi:hypothetical protein
MPSFIRPIRSRCAFLATATCTALLGITPSVAAGDPVQQPTCPPGYELGALTFEDVVQLYAGLYTEEQLAPVFAGLDVNGNGLLCFKQPPAFSTIPRFELHPYLFIDDPGGNPG